MKAKHKNVNIKIGKLIDTNIDVSRIVKLDVASRFIHLDEMKDGTWRVVYSKVEEAPSES